MSEVQPPLICTSTIKLALLKEFASAPQEKRDEAICLAAAVMAENSSQPLPNTLDECFNTLARPVPRPFTIGTILPIEVRSVIKETLTIFVKHATPMPQLLQTAELEERERTVTLPGGIRVPKTAPEPYCIFYPHLWQRTQVEQWFRHWAGLLAGTTVADIHLFKMRRLEQGVRAWFESLTSDLTQQQVAIFFTMVDLLAELFLLIKGANNRPSIATLNFSAAVEGRRHGARPLDYFADLASARVATELPKNGMFRL